ncbi:MULTISPECIES: hypothetical protein [Pantoea]|uniref:hypothetical protein n=1 Tax=Pantoea TaxID=53335 RepID=UPI001B31104C|nr:MULTISPECIES: hypothetical protein [Pantoea]MCL9647446.1 hypothetical protein [Pantoea eucrina]
MNLFIGFLCTLFLVVRCIVFSIIDLFNTQPFKKIPAKIFYALLFVSIIIKVSDFVGHFRLAILFTLPILMGLIFSHYVYPVKGALLKNLNDAILYSVATLTAGVLVANSAQADINFFNEYMISFFGYVSSSLFCFCTTIKFYIALKDTYNEKKKIDALK